MINNNFKSILVNKPWGHEYLIYENSKVAIWYLSIDYKKKTSLHCHPKKKTGLILLNGKIEVDVGFYQKKIFSKFDKLMIRPGLFHSTKGLCKKGSIILEIETPKDKNDLVRFKDKYGRQKKPYEGKSFMKTIPQNKLQLFRKSKIKKDGFEYQIKSFKKNINQNFLKKNKIYAILDGGLGINKNQIVLGPGDIVRQNTIKTLLKSFKPTPNIKILSIRKCLTKKYS